jgi:hypothetical protein
MTQTPRASLFASPANPQRKTSRLPTTHLPETQTNTSSSDFQLGYRCGLAAPYCNHLAPQIPDLCEMDAPGLAACKDAVRRRPAANLTEDDYTYACGVRDWKSHSERCECGLRASRCPSLCTDMKCGEGYVASCGALLAGGHVAVNGHREDEYVSF